MKHRKSGQKSVPHEKLTFFLTHRTGTAQSSENLLQVAPNQTWLKSTQHAADPSQHQEQLPQHLYVSSWWILDICLPVMKR